MAPIECISLLTDYGLEDGFVAVCHGVAARISPRARVIDITHLVPAGDVRRGALVLAQTVPYLPAGVHVAVVDPGVGTARRAVAVEAQGRIFVGPDNGLLSWAAHGIFRQEDAQARTGGPVRAFELTNRRLWLSPVSATFHGRDIFMPVAAHLAGGVDIAETGAALDVDELVSLPTPVRRVEDGQVQGEVLIADRFGNIQLSVTEADLARAGVRTGDPITFILGPATEEEFAERPEPGRPQRHKRLTVHYRHTFGAVAPGALLALPDSAGFIALAVNAGNAAQLLGLPPGAPVRIIPGGDAG